MRSQPIIRVGFWILAWAAAAVPSSFAGEADVLDVRVLEKVPGFFDFAVTVAHKDTGWEHYADRWQVLAPDGTLLGERVLLHPHVQEQPFTRSLGAVAIPENIDRVTIRAGDNVHNFGGRELTVNLPGRAGG